MITTERDIDSSMAEHLTAELKTAVLSGEFVDQDLLDLADNVLSAHQIYVQLLYVGMVVDRISQLSFYFDALGRYGRDPRHRGFGRSVYGLKRSGQFQRLIRRSRLRSRSLIT